MGAATGISWTDSTFNPWIGCTKVSPGCDHCYAETLDARHKWGGRTHWGSGTPRHRTSPSTWKNPVKWNDAGPRRVFCASLADVFDNEAPQQWRDDLWQIIEATPNLTWQLLTKRIGNVMDMVPDGWRGLFPRNVWMGMTAPNQDEYERDIVKLARIPSRVRWLSLEPQLSHITLGPWVGHASSFVSWVVTGGESGPKARIYDINWARSIVRQCRESGGIPFVKQLGSKAGMKDRNGADPSEWPDDLRVQEFPA